MYHQQILIGLTVLLIILSIVLFFLTRKSSTSSNTESEDDASNSISNMVVRGESTIGKDCPGCGNPTPQNPNYPVFPSGCCVTKSCPKIGTPKKPKKVGMCKTFAPPENEMKSQLSKSMSQSAISKMQPGLVKAAFIKNMIWRVKALNVFFIRDKNYSVEKANFVRNSVERILAPVVGIEFNWEPKLEKGGIKHIKITFDKDDGAWSYVGRQSEFNSPSMNLGWLDNDRDYDFPAAKGKATVVIHEFCHALGMIHEHSRRDADLPWNCEAIYQIAGAPPNNWSRAKVNAQIFTPERNFVGSVYDPYSIMHYYFPDDNFMYPVGLPHNTELSCLDKCWLRRAYPKN